MKWLSFLFCYSNLKFILRIYKYKSSYIDPGVLFMFFFYILKEIMYFIILLSCYAAALERELWSTATINEEVLKTLHVMFMNFPKLHISEAATLCIPHLVGALKSGGEVAQDSVLDTFCLLKQSWSTMPIEIAKSQAMIAAEAIPILQMLMKTCPPSFHERADTLLHCLPGCLTVIIKRGSNLKQTMGSTNAFCRLTLGNSPPKQTKVFPCLIEKFCRSNNIMSLSFNWLKLQLIRKVKVLVYCSLQSFFFLFFLFIISSFIF